MTVVSGQAEDIHWGGRNMMLLTSSPGKHLVYMPGSLVLVCISASFKLAQGP